MANRPKGFGMTAELQRKKDAKYDSDAALQVIQWINRTINDPEIAIPEDGSSQNLQTSLKNGYVLCRLLQSLGCLKNKKIGTPTMAFKQMEQISFFLEGVSGPPYNLLKTDLFQTVDLYEGQNLPAVITCLESLGRKVQTLGGDGFGPKEASANKRDFTDEQLNAGQGVIGLQMGTNKLASQAGQSFGKPRHIVD